MTSSFYDKEINNFETSVQRYMDYRNFGFEKDIRQINALINDASNLNNDEINALKRLVKLIQNNIRINFFTYLVKNNSNAQNLINELTIAIKDAKNELNEINDLINNSTIPYESYRKNALERFISEVENLIVALKSNDFAMASASISENITDSIDLIDLCSITLKNAFNDYREWFGVQIVDEFGEFNPELITCIFSIISNKELNDQITLGVKKKQEINSLIESITKEENKLNIYLKIKDNYLLVKEYLYYRNAIELNLQKINTTYFLIENNQQLLEKNADNNIFSRIINNSNNVKINANIKALLADLESLKEEQLSLNEKLNDKLLKLREVGLGSVINKIENFVAIDNQKNMPTLIDSDLSVIMAIITRTTKKIAAEKISLTNLNNDYNDYLLTISAEAKNFLETEFDDCEKVIRLEEDDFHQSIDPIVAAFILKVIIAEKNIPWQEVIEYVQIDENLEELKHTYNNLINKNISEIKENYEEFKQDVLEENQPLKL